MRLHEHEAADIFEAAGIPVPRRSIAETTEEALLIADEIGYPVVIKAQVLVGGRGLAGTSRLYPGLKSLKKRFKEPAFAKGARREDIMSCSELDLELEEFLALGLKAMQGVADELGL